MTETVSQVALVERTVLLAIVSGLIAWVSAKWQAARAVERTVGGTMQSLDSKLDQYRGAMETRMAAIERAMEIGRQATKAEHEAAHADVRLRMQRVEQTIFGDGVEGGIALRVRQTSEAQVQDRLAMHRVLGQLETISAALGDLRAEVKALHAAASGHGPGGTQR